MCARACDHRARRPHEYVRRKLASAVSEPHACAHERRAVRMTLLADLRSAVGPAFVLHDGDLSAYEFDWRKRYQGRALAVVRPSNAGEVAAVVRVSVSGRAT